MIYKSYKKKFFVRYRRNQHFGPQVLISWGPFSRRQKSQKNFGIFEFLQSKESTQKILQPNHKVFIRFTLDKIFNF